MGKYVISGNNAYPAVIGGVDAVFFKIASCVIWQGFTQAVGSRRFILLFIKAVLSPSADTKPVKTAIKSIIAEISFICFIAKTPVPF